MRIIQDVIDHWRNDWQNNRTIFWIELIGVCLSATSTAIISFMATNPPMMFCYTVWLFGSGLIMVAAYMRKASWMTVLMAFYTCMNIVGIATLVLS